MMITPETVIDIEDTEEEVSTEEDAAAVTSEVKKEEDGETC